MEESLFAKTIEGIKKEEPWNNYPQEIQAEGFSGAHNDAKKSEETPNVGTKEWNRSKVKEETAGDYDEMNESVFFSRPNPSPDLTGNTVGYGDTEEALPFEEPALELSSAQMELSPREHPFLQRPAKTMKTSYNLTFWWCPFEDCGAAFREQRRLINHLDMHRLDRDFVSEKNLNPGIPLKPVVPQQLLKPGGPPKKVAAPLKLLKPKTPTKPLEPEVPPKLLKPDAHPWICPVKACNTGFYLFPLLQSHMHSAHPGVKPIWCPCCPTNFRVPHDYWTHMKTEHGVLKPEADPSGYTCEGCGAHFPHLLLYHRHCQYYKDIPHFYCGPCQMHVYKEEMARHSKTNKHRQLFNITEEIKCEECSKPCSNVKAYTHHCKTFGGHPHVYCKPCNVAVWETDLEKHQESQRHRVALNLPPRGPYVCEDCGKVAENHASQHRHTFLFSNRPHVYCELCNKVVDQGDWDHHQNLDSHKKDEDSVPEEGPEKNTCEDCGRRFEQKGQYREHRRLFERRPHFYCETWNMTVDQEKLEKHELSKPHRMRTSGYEPPWKCHVHECGGAFASLRLLTEHMVDHPGQLPLRCRHCPLQFYNNRFLKRHMELDHGQDPNVDP